MQNSKVILTGEGVEVYDRSNSIKVRTSVVVQA